MASSEQLKSYLLPNVEDTGRVLGKGAYGEVVEMKLPNGTVVAGKKIHSILFDPSNDSAHIRSLKERFQQECMRWSYSLWFIFSSSNKTH